MNDITIDRDIFNEILTKVNHAIYETRYNFKCNRENIIIAMPKYVLEALKFLNGESIIQEFEKHHMFAGCKIQYHFENKIVVFFDDCTRLNLPFKTIELEPMLIHSN